MYQERIKQTHIMKNAKQIIAEAKKELKDNIAFNGQELYLLLNNLQFPNFENDEEYVIKFSDIYSGLRFEIMEYSNWKDMEPAIIGNHYLWEIRITLDDNVFFSDGENEFDYDYPTVEELGRIAELVENKYLKLLNKLK